MNPNKRLTFITIGAIAFAFIVVIISVLFLIFHQPSGTFGPEVPIGNYDSYVNLNRERRSTINNQLYNIIQSNSSDPDSSIIPRDANIRDGSLIESFDTNTNVHNDSFIVDIESIGQSYLVNFKWSDDPSNPKLSGYPVAITCLPVEQLIFGDFGCRDNLFIRTNPIINHLPYSDLHLRITSADLDQPKPTLDIQITLYWFDTENLSHESALERYKSQAIDWIKNIEFDPDDFVLNFHE